MVCDHGWRDEIDCDVCRPQAASVAALRDLAAGMAEKNERIAELEAALSDAIEGWQEGAAYKGDYLREKHGDAEGIAKARAILANR